jgi:hypothetical protein
MDASQCPSVSCQLPLLPFHTEMSHPAFGTSTSPAYTTGNIAQHIFTRMTIHWRAVSVHQLRPDLRLPRKHMNTATLGSQAEIPARSISSSLLTIRLPQGEADVELQ